MDHHIDEQRSTHLVKSSEHMASQRFNEEFFFWIPLKALGAVGKLGRWMPFISIELSLCNWTREWNKLSSVIPENESTQVPLMRIYSPWVEKKMRSINKFQRSMQLISIELSSCDWSRESNNFPWFLKMNLQKFHWC